LSPRQRQVRELLLSIDRGRGGAIGRQIEAQLRKAVTSGLLPRGAALPSTRVLAEDLSVSRGVVVRVYSQLAAEGYITLRQGANPCVNGFPATASVSVEQQNESAERYRFDLRPDLPDLAGFPRHGWLRAQKRALQSASTQEMGSTDPRGLRALREELAAYLGRSRGVVVQPEDLVVTAGTLQSLDLVTRVLAAEGVAEMAVENPSCALLHAAVRRAGVEPRGVRVDEQGLIVSELYGARLGAVVVCATHQFPTGIKLSDSRRAQLIDWATDTGGLIIESDSEFRYDNALAAPLQRQAPDRVIYLGSPQKTLGPNPPLGWAVLPAGLTRSVRDLPTLLQVSSFDQLAFGDFLARGDYDRHIRKMREIYRKRRAVVIDVLQREFPDSPVVGPAAGLHVVMLTGRGGVARSVCASARERRVALGSICDHTLPGYDGPEGLLVGFGQITEAAIPGAAAELRRAFAAAASAM
jgi:GntR family transcriptional regulator / MocR family aminotransferase